jgi:hypothetical protein
MTQSVTASTLELLTWIAGGRRTYADAMDAWRSSCPRHAVWEDAVVDGLVRVVRREVVLTALGREALYGPTENGRLTAAT